MSPFWSLPPQCCCLVRAQLWPASRWSRIPDCFSSVFVVLHHQHHQHQHQHQQSSCPAAAVMAATHFDSRASLVGVKKVQLWSIVTKAQIGVGRFLLAFWFGEKLPNPAQNSRWNEHYNCQTKNKKQAGRYTEVSVERTFPKQEIPTGPAFLFLIFISINRCSIIMYLAPKNSFFFFFALRTNNIYIYTYIFLEPYLWAMSLFWNKAQW